ncbi:Signal-induced proliferation-associated 1-like protein 2 [Trichinella sp. T9]|nr:Signal-induced proliferation-associated 1-like protein 2 [Trichinella sp. T9]
MHHLVGRTSLEADDTEKLTKLMHTFCGLRQRSRIIEISKVSVASLTYPKMLEFLNNANTRVLVIPPLNDGSPRRGCEDPHCPSVRGEVTPIIPTVRVPHYSTFPPR